MLHPWISREVRAMPLRTIEAEIARILALPADQRSVSDVDRLAELREAQRRISTGGAW